MPLAMLLSFNIVQSNVVVHALSCLVFCTYVYSQPRAKGLLLAKLLSTNNIVFVVQILSSLVFHRNVIYSANVHSAPLATLKTSFCILACLVSPTNVHSQLPCNIKDQGSLSTARHCRHRFFLHTYCSYWLGTQLAPTCSL